MAYSENILPKYSVYYELVDATITNGVINLGGNGTVKLNVDKTLLDSIPSSILFNIGTASISTSGYNPTIKMILEADMENGATQHVEIFHSGSTTDVSSIEVALTSGYYTKCTLVITATEACTLGLWEMCPLQDVDVTTIIDGVEQSLPKVLYDYNTSRITVMQDESTIAMIACNLLGNTDVNAHLAFDFYSTDYCNVYIRCKDNGVTELYAPLMYTAQPGHNTIGLPHAYLKRLIGVHNFVVTCQCTSGTITCYPRGVLYTIDAGHLAEQLIDAGLDLLDLSIKQTVVDYAPEEIWAVGDDSGVITVKSRPYEEAASAAWTPRYSIGPGIAAAIEFDGKWVLRENSDIYTLETDDAPHVFVVETDGTLVVYTDNDVDTRIVLDTGVSSVCAVRGYKSEVYAEQDQGLLCVYIKDGALYYRAYAYNTDAYAWLPVVSIETEGVVTQVSVHRLNDYRVGILYSTDTENFWILADRTYVNQAVPEERVYVRSKVDYAFTSMTSPNWVLTGTPCTFEEPTDPQDTFTITYDGPLAILGTQLTPASFASVTVNGASVEIESVTITNNVLTVKLKEPASWTRASAATIILTVNNASRKLYLKTSNEGHGVPIKSETFTWTIERPIFTINCYSNEETTIQPELTSVSAVMKPLVTTRLTDVEILDALPVFTGTITMKQLNKIALVQNEVLTVEPTLTVTTLECLQVGEKPI